MLFKIIDVENGIYNQNGTYIREKIERVEKLAWPLTYLYGHIHVKWLL